MHYYAAMDSVLLRQCLGKKGRYAGAISIPITFFVTAAGHLYGEMTEMVPFEW